ncbi:hypothetical protein [Streptomyces sp. SID13031]|uniref:hypothetical protein n=1 Tax=Streptomyces sp. SID13031 TaxID=2706046 RepID=UPI0013CACC34|nr:hypothetical protein [Streptomyces sp. SID13031]NEA36273.1 hypothetical protein [Streptomyces sp. SID13031]
MNLDDLRSQLRQQADEVDPLVAAPLPEIRRRSTSLKRRRIAALAGGVAATVALAIGFLPSVIHNSAPDPAAPPKDYTRNGITLPGTVGADWLQRPWIGAPGEVPGEFDWMPKSQQDVTFRPFCRTSAARAKDVRVTVNGHLLVEKACDDTGSSPTKTETIGPNSVLWIDTPRDKFATVRVFVVDRTSKLVGDPTAQVALGIYSSPPKAPEPNGVPERVPPTQPGDYVKDLVRYRATSGADTLAGAIVGDPGQENLTLRFTATGEPIALRLFCTANKGGSDDPQYRLAIRVNGGAARDEICFNASTDATIEGNHPLPGRFPAGQAMEITVALVKTDGTPTTMPDVRLGVGAYFQQPLRVIKDGNGATKSLEEAIEMGGYDYKLAEVRTVDAASVRQMSIATPAGKPYLLVAGSTSLGSPTAAGVLDDRGTETMMMTNAPMDDAFGMTVTGRPAYPSAGRATLKVTAGKPTKGKLVIALYLP